MYTLVVFGGKKWEIVGMFYGEYIHSIDKKGRVIVPSKFRDVFKEHYAEKLFITRGLDSCLFVFMEEEWRIQERKFKEMSFTSKQARAFNRLFFTGASEVVFDKQGRILIPQYLLDHASIKGDVMVVGVSDRIEVWSKEKWDAFVNDSMQDFEDLAETLLDPGKDKQA